MKCPACDSLAKAGELLETKIINSVKYFKCSNCQGLNANRYWNKDSNKKEFRPKHYEKGHDTFEWAEHKFDLETNLNICRFNIHKYNDRDKGQDKEDFQKIIDYAQHALYLIQEDKQEVTFDE